MAGWRTYREQHGRGIERNASEESSDFLLFQNQLEPKSGGQPVDGLLPKLRGEAIAKTTSQPPVSTALGAASPKSRIENVVALVYTRTGYSRKLRSAAKRPLAFRQASIRHRKLRRGNLTS